MASSSNSVNIVPEPVSRARVGTNKKEEEAYSCAEFENPTWQAQARKTPIQFLGASSKVGVNN